MGTGPVINLIVSLGLFLPGLAVAVRRLHDRNKSGWWFLIILISFIGVIVLIIWFVGRGDSGQNNYGPDPL